MGATMVGEAASVARAAVLEPPAGRGEERRTRGRYRGGGGGGGGMEGHGQLMALSAY